MDTHRILIRPAPSYEIPACTAGGRCRHACPTPEAEIRRRRDAVHAIAHTRPAISSSHPANPAETENAMAARRFAVATLTQVLEVLDRRRGIRHLDPVVAAHLTDQITALIPSHGARGTPSGPENTATLRRVHVQMGGLDSAEVFGSYRRGTRVRAFAGRIERRPRRIRTATRGTYTSRGSQSVEYRWQLVAFSIA